MIKQIYQDRANNFDENALLLSVSCVNRHFLARERMPLSFVLVGTTAVQLNDAGELAYHKLYLCTNSWDVSGKWVIILVKLLKYKVIYFICNIYSCAKQNYNRA